MNAKEDRQPDMICFYMMRSIKERSGTWAITTATYNILSAVFPGVCGSVPAFTIKF